MVHRYDPLLGRGIPCIGSTGDMAYRSRSSRNPRLLDVACPRSFHVLLKNGCFRPPPRTIPLRKTTTSHLEGHSLQRCDDHHPSSRRLSTSYVRGSDLTTVGPGRRHPLPYHREPTAYRWPGLRPVRSERRRRRPLRLLHPRPRRRCTSTASIIHRLGNNLSYHGNNLSYL